MLLLLQMTKSKALPRAFVRAGFVETVCGIIQRLWDDGLESATATFLDALGALARWQAVVPAPAVEGIRSVLNRIVQDRRPCCDPQVEPFAEMSRQQAMVVLMAFE